MNVILNLYCLIPDHCLSLEWPVMDQSIVNYEHVISSGPGNLVLEKHAAVRHGESYLCYTTYAMVFGCRVHFGPHVSYAPLFSLPAMDLTQFHQVSLNIYSM